MQQKCKKKALSMILSISMGLGSVASFNVSNTFADTIEESTNAGNVEGDTNAGNVEGDTNAGNAEGDTNAGNAEGDTNAGNAEGDTNAGNAEGDTNAGNAEGDTNEGNAEGDTNEVLVEEDTNAEEYDSVGDFKISGGEINVDFKFESGVLTILSGKQMTIQNNNPNTPTTHRIVIPKDVKAELIFNGVNIKTASNSPFTLTPDKDGGAYAHIILQDGSKNILKSGDQLYPGIRAGKSTTLIIDDSVVNRDIEGEFIVPENGKIPRDVTLENGDKLKKGDRLTLLDSKNRGSLTAVGNSYAAGIGGGDTENGGNIIINGGIINATAMEGYNTGFGAGIGGGSIGDGGDITINGGTVTAKGAYHGAGIGGAYYISGNHTLSPSVVDRNKGGGYSGNITINGGLCYSYGGAHGSAFGDGCVNPGANRGYRVLVTGGTVLPYMTGAGDWIFDLSAITGDVIVTGGSLKATTFKSSGETVAYGDLEKKTKVFMSKVSLKYLGQDKVNTKLVDDFTMQINGKEYPYGAPSYTDDQGVLYLWFSDKFTGSEVSVKLAIVDKDTGDTLKSDTFYIKDIGPTTPFLKQYEEFIIDEINTPPGSINKRYDGLPFGKEQEKAFLDWILKDGIPVTNPKGGKLTDGTYIIISSQRLNEETMEPDTSLGSDDLTKQVDVGKYQLIITSKQYASVAPFNESYWGHRSHYNYAEITPADTETSLVVETPKVKTDVFKPTDTFTLNATVSPDKKEGPDCASPKGYVQFYINGKEYKDPVELKTHDKVSESHNYSTASIEWKPLDSNHHILNTEQTITVKYIGDDINYTKDSKDEKKLKLDITNVDIDGDGIPDINIDTDGDGRPDINIDTSGDWKPDINIDTDNTGEWKPSTEGGNRDGIWKPDKNIDTNGDGNPDTDYNRPAIDTDNDGVDDYWKPDKNVDTDSGGYDTGNPDPNKPDPDNPNPDNGGNSKPDSGNGGNSKPDSDNGGNSKPDIDTDGDGKPDIDGDGKPDIDIDTDGDGKPDINIDTDGDGKPDINIDIDGDGKPDINIDIDGDGKPDINIDIDGDGKPDINIDIDGDGKSDVNIDIDGDGKPDINIDTDESLDSNAGQNVQTGDQSNIMLDLALMFTSLFFLIKNLINKYLRRK
ncbi:TPA: hypothetical protein KQB54_001185 [Clostridioides difficile]|nr:hypothetical protein [Clostridioides difficile]HBG6759708.1 hypothetical protein [Clostridioides difficile]HBG8751439.1 hypothetical protein [Clostridioides difficile]HBG9127995.1 hypothetical protein [Clostridioides difficile]HBH1118687.1 hypothetical protein [Clostridioides difficile]